MSNAFGWLRDKLSKFFGSSPALTSSHHDEPADVASECPPVKDECPQVWRNESRFPEKTIEALRELGFEPHVDRRDLGAVHFERVGYAMTYTSLRVMLYGSPSNYTLSVSLPDPHTLVHLSIRSSGISHEGAIPTGDLTFDRIFSVSMPEYCEGEQVLSPQTRQYMSGIRPQWIAHQIGVVDGEVVCSVLDRDGEDRMQPVLSSHAEDGLIPQMAAIAHSLHNDFTSILCVSQEIVSGENRAGVN